MMPPKATEKKLVAKKAAAFIQKDIDSTKYIRKQEILEPINPVTVPQLTGFIALIDKIFPEWSKTNQNWHDVQDTEEYANYPQELTHHSIQSIRTLLNLDTSESKAKSKGDTKKGKEASLEVISEAHTDDEGRRLPRIVFCDDGSLNDYSRPLLFMRTYSGEQIGRMSLQEISTCDATSNKVCKNAVEGSSRKIPMKHDNEVEEPTGSEIDPCMCAVFRIIAEFAKSSKNYIDESNSSDRGDSQSRFLWNSIYPQLASGRPVYNPTGKYTVRLFFGGKWRKVQVTDIIPIGPHGCAIARSKESHELWPVILSKAVYSLYTACGYHNSLPTLQRSSSEKHDKKQSMMSSSSLSSAHKTSFFISFAVHALTGWHPTTPRSVKDTVNLDIQGVRSMLKDILAGGAQIITDREVPRLKPSILRQSSLEIFQDLNEYQTKSYFREEYDMRLAERAQVIEENQIREDLVKSLDNILSEPMSEGFVLCTHDEALVNVLTVPVLGLCLSTTGCVGGQETSRSLSSSELIQFIEGKEKEKSGYAIVNRIKLLVNWRTSPPISSHSSSSSIPSQVNVNSTDAAGMLKELNKPLPPTSSIDYRWITLEELSAKEGFLIGIDTHAQKRYEAQYHWPWVPLGPDKDKEKERGEKGVDRGTRSSIKGKAADSMKGSSVLCGDQGTCPPLLLTLDTTDYFNSNSGNEYSDAAPEAVPTSCPALQGTKSIKTCISLSLLVYTDIIVPPDCAGSDLVTKTPLSVVNKDKVSASGTLNLPIKTDLKVKIPHMNILDDRSFYNQGCQCSDYEVEGGGGCEIDMMPSGVTVILQEIRTDGAEPYVMRAELSSAARIPLARTTFHIPSERVDKTTGRMVFWVRLFSKASVHMIVSSLAPVMLGEAEDVWAGMGGSVLVREGEAAPTRHRTEQMLFRVPLQLEVPGKSCDDESEKDGNKESVAKPSLNYSPHASCSSSKDSRTEHQVTAFLHISCREVARSVSLILSSGEAVSLPRIDGNCFLLSSRGNTVMTGRCYVSDSAHRALPAFKWKLIIISCVALSELTASTSTSIVKALQQRCRGYYRPNNRLMIFKDIYSIDSATFPIALRISLDSLSVSSVCALDILEGQGQGQGLMEGEGANTSINMENINFIVRLYRGTDRTLIAESRGRGVLQLYHISLESLLSTTLPEQVNEPNLDTLGKSRKVSAKKTCDLKSTGLGRKTLQGDEVELIVECTVDESAMLVPPLWRSRIPFNFNIDSADSSIGTGQGQMLGQNTYRSKSRDSCDEKVSCTPTSLLSSLNSATALPQFRWQVDILAGSVLSVSHDTYALEAQINLKNTWEEGSHGRAFRATAAMAFAVEKKAFKAAHLLSLHSTSDENITTGTGICTAVAGLGGNVREKLIDLLTIALEKEDRTSVTEREARLLDLGEYKEHMEDWRSTAPHIFEPAAVEMQKLQRAQRKESTEVESRRINAAVLELNETIQNRASLRVQSITAQAVAAAACIASHWEVREVHRLDCVRKVQAHRMQTDLHAADCAALAAANELALLGEAKDRKPQRGRGVQ